MMTARFRIEHIVFDYLRRYWWTFLVGGMLQFYAGNLLVDSRFLTSIGFVFGAGFLLGFEILRGDKSITRTLLTLPVSASEVSWTWRILGLLLPIIFYLSAFSFGVLSSHEEEAEYLVFSNLQFYFALQIGILGLIFYALTGVVEFRGSSNQSALNVKGIFFTFLWCSMLAGSAFCGLLIRWQSSEGTLQEQPEVSFIIWVVLIVATIAGFFRADILVANRYLLLDHEKPIVDAGKDVSDAEKTWQGIGNLRYFIGSVSSFMFAGFFAFVSASWVVASSLGGLNGNGNRIEMLFGNQIQMNFILPFFGLAVILKSLPILRLLRTLPIQLDSLTSLLILWPFCLMAVLAGSCMAVSAVVNGIPMNWENYFVSLSGASITLFFAPFVLRFGTNFFTLVISVVVTVLASWRVNVVLRSDGWSDLETSAYLSSLLLTILTLTWVMSYLVLRSTHPWKSGHFSSSLGGPRSSR